jgi:hypothetical protein
VAACEQIPEANRASLPPGTPDAIYAVEAMVRDVGTSGVSDVGGLLAQLGGAP